MRLFSLIFVCSLVFGTTAQAQSLDLVGTVELASTPRPGAEEMQHDGGIRVTDTVGGSDVWAYTAPDGSEYALMGDLNGIAVVAVPSLEVVAHVAGPTENAPFYWRDIKTYGSYAYVATEAHGESEGLQVIDLSGLPDSVEEVSVIRGTDDRLVSSHNLSIDTVTGHAYMLNSNGTEIVCLDLSNPVEPVEVAVVGIEDSHDIYAHDDVLYIAEGRAGTFSIWDMSDKANPTLLNRVAVPDAGYVHNIWPTDDGQYILTTEENVDKTVKVWDISDIANPELVGEWLGASRIAHNAHIQGRYAFISHYSSGVHVLDISDLTSPVEVARFDTHPEDDAPGFSGNWGTIPPTGGGYVYASDLEGTLTVLKWTPPQVDI
ncbi:MAG: choice-of-anchor B family protein [Rubricoccaceae bacterium]|nr:choice-of-anchor B family protein [Rubricoccaceae bacterium]